MSNPIKTRLLDAAQKHASRSALWIAGQNWSYENLFSNALALAERIDETVQAGQPLGIHCQRDFPSLVGTLAAVLSDRPFVPLNPGFPIDRLEKIATLSGLGAVVSSEETEPVSRQLISRLPRSVILFNDTGDILKNSQNTAAPEDAMWQDTAYFMFTSGTTGDPKGVRVSYSNLAAYLDGIAPIANINEQDRCTHFFDLSFDLSVHDLMVTWTAGAELSVLPKSEGMKIVDFCYERKITSWFSVPSLANFCDRLGQLKENSLPDLQLALFCGEPLPVALAEKFKITAPSSRLWNLYGPTEATIAFSAQEFRSAEEFENLSVVPLGFPLGEGQMEVDTADDVRGELLLGGPQVTPGYINSPEQNASQFFDAADGTRFYRSGDIVQRSEKFGFIYHGRIDDQVKINGYRVELLEIEAVLRKAAGTMEVAALAWPDTGTGHADQVLAFITEPKSEISAIKAACRNALPNYMVPRRFHVIDKMPVTASGKIDRKVLRGLLGPTGAVKQ